MRVLVFVNFRACVFFISIACWALYISLLHRAALLLSARQAQTFHSINLLRMT
jgi:hypothetical protein